MENKLLLLLTILLLAKSTICAQDTVDARNDIIICFTQTAPHSYIDSLRQAWSATELDQTQPSNCRLWDLNDEDCVGFPVLLIEIQQSIKKAKVETEVEGLFWNQYVYTPEDQDCGQGGDNPDNKPAYPVDGNNTTGCQCDNSLPEGCTDNTAAVVIALIDTGIETGHPFFENGDYFWQNENEIPENGIDDDENGYVDDLAGYNFSDGHHFAYDDNSHGTHLSGIMVQMLNLAGAVDVQIMNLKTQDAGGRGELYQVIKALDYAVINGAAVANMSLAYQYNTPFFPCATPDAATHVETMSESEIEDPLKHAITVARTYDLLVLTSAGNDFLDIDDEHFYPASFDVENLITVSATDCYNQLAGFSNFGNLHSDLGAAGVNIFSTVPSWYSPAGNYSGTNATIPGWDYKSGTSMSSAVVAAAAAIIGSNHQNFIQAEIKAEVLGNTIFVPALYGLVQTSGVVNERPGCVEDRVAYDTDPSNAAQEVRAYPVPVEDRLYIEINSIYYEYAVILLYNLQGQLIFSKKQALEPGMNNIVFNTASLMPGNYFAEIRIGEKVNRVKLVK